MRIDAEMRAELEQLAANWEAFRCDWSRSNPRLRYSGDAPWEGEAQRAEICARELRALLARTVESEPELPEALNLQPKRRPAVAHVIERKKAEFRFVDEGEP